MSEQEKIEFKVSFSPKASWVDNIYLGNLLTEMLGALKQKYQLFDFDVSLLPKSQASEKT